MKNYFLKIICLPIFLIGLISFSTLYAQTGVYTLNGGTATKTGQTYSATSADQSSVYVLNSGILTLNNCTLNKTGNSSNVNNSSQYGTNAALLVTSAGVVTVSGGSITTNATGANGLFATGTNSRIIMTGGTINATAASSHGVDVTYSGSITLNNVNITTFGSNSSVIATDFGGGTDTINGGTFLAADTVDGSHSAGIYSTGTIKVSNATVTSSADNGGVIDGANSIILVNTSLSGKTEGIMIWKTAPATGNAIVSITGGSLTTSNGDAFYFNGGTGNTSSGTVTVSSGTTISAGSGNIVNAVSPASANFIANNVTISGNIISTGSSTINTTLHDTTSLTGAINNSNTAALVTLNIDCSSTWTVTAISHLNGLITDPCITGTSVSNIIGNGNNVFYSTSTNTGLGGLTYNLVNGGYLLPEGSSGCNNITNNDDINLYVYPNPFKENVCVSYNLTETSNIELTVMDLKGKVIDKISKKSQLPGKITLFLDYESKMQSGNYIIQLHGTNSNGSFILTKKIIVKK